MENYPRIFRKYFDARFPIHPDDHEVIVRGVNMDREREQDMNILVARLVTDIWKKSPGSVIIGSLGNGSSVIFEFNKKSYFSVHLEYTIASTGNNYVNGWTQFEDGILDLHKMEHELLVAEVFKTPVNSICISHLYRMVRMWDELS